MFPWHVLHCIHAKNTVTGSLEKHIFQLRACACPKITQDICWWPIYLCHMLYLWHKNSHPEAAAKGHVFLTKQKTPDKSDNKNRYHYSEQNPYESIFHLLLCMIFLSSYYRSGNKSEHKDCHEYSNNYKSHNINSGKQEE